MDTWKIFVGIFAICFVVGLLTGWFLLPPTENSATSVFVLVVLVAVLMGGGVLLGLFVAWLTRLG